MTFLLVAGICLYLFAAAVTLYCAGAAQIEFDLALIMMALLWPVVIVLVPLIVVAEKLHVAGQKQTRE